MCCSYLRLSRLTAKEIKTTSQEHRECRAAEGAVPARRWAAFKVAAPPCWPSSPEQHGPPRDRSGHGCGSLPQPCVSTSCTASLQRAGCRPRNAADHGSTFIPQHGLPPGACAMAAAWERDGRGLGAPLRARPLTDGPGARDGRRWSRRWMVLEPMTDVPGAGDAPEQGKPSPPPQPAGAAPRGAAPAAPRPRCPGPGASGAASPALRARAALVWPSFLPSFFF